MFFGLFRKRSHADAANALYATIVAQARAPHFYAALGVPDTPAGRLDMILLHVVLVSARFSTENVAQRGVAQAVFDRFCEDMDDNLREDGVADTKVPKRMKAIGEAFYGRAMAYEAALAQADDSAFIAALERNVYGGAAPQAMRLARYGRAAARALSEYSVETFEKAAISWPEAGEF